MRLCWFGPALGLTHGVGETPVRWRDAHRHRRPKPLHISLAYTKKWRLVDDLRILPASVKRWNFLHHTETRKPWGSKVATVFQTGYDNCLPQTPIGPRKHGSSENDPRGDAYILQSFLGTLGTFASFASKYFPRLSSAAEPCFAVELCFTIRQLRTIQRPTVEIYQKASPPQVEHDRGWEVEKAQDVVRYSSFVSLVRAWRIYGRLGAHSDVPMRQHGSNKLSIHCGNRNPDLQNSVKQQKPLPGKQPKRPRRDSLRSAGSILIDLFALNKNDITLVHVWSSLRRNSTKCEAAKAEFR
ncbi:hypothetical protein C8R45DRAFT_1076816 [Mycena sanguinolenta]|nr:hypothetical protein C8R45DRAFT_1076816 [Mycena sanguinolenta]